MEKIEIKGFIEIEKEEYQNLEDDGDKEVIKLKHWCKGKITPYTLYFKKVDLCEPKDLREYALGKGTMEGEESTDELIKKELDKDYASNTEGEQ